MRVSDELVERLGYALDACEFKTPYADVPSMLRRILEDVLLHVPEPLSAAERSALFVHGRDKDRIEAQHQRIAELAEKLEAATHEIQCPRDRAEDTYRRIERLKNGSEIALQAHLDAVREALPHDLLLEHDGYPHSAVQALVARVAELEKRLQRVREWRVFSEAPFPEIAARPHSRPGGDSMTTEARIPRERLRQLAVAMSRPGVYEASVSYDWDRPDGVAREVLGLLDQVAGLEAKLTALQELADAWLEMARDEEDPAVAWARKSCVADVRALLKETP